MTRAQWEAITSTVKGTNKCVAAAAIIDSPWIPGYCGCSFLDFYCRPDIWFEDYKKVHNDFPTVSFLPDWWVEYGMAAEPSGFGARIRFSDDNMPTVYPVIDSQDKIGEITASLPDPDPRADGLMPLILNMQRMHMPRIEEIGEIVPMVCARGPFTIASHLLPMTDLLISVMEEPEVVLKLLRKTTRLVIRWLQAQLESVRTAEAVMVLDDVCGFLDGDTFLRTAFPLFREIFDAFPGMIHMFHNDTPRDSCYPFLEAMGVDIFNFSHGIDIGSVRRAVGERVVLMGNVPPMSLSRLTPEEVYSESKRILHRYCDVNGGPGGLLLSVGGGVPMGAKGENLRAVIRAADEFNAKLLP